MYSTPQICHLRTYGCHNRYTLLIGKPPFETKDVKTTYVRIKANMYSFPDNVPISECAKSLIRRILHTIPGYTPLFILRGRILTSHKQKHDLQWMKFFNILFSVEATLFLKCFQPVRSITHHLLPSLLKNLLSDLLLLLLPLTNQNLPLVYRYLNVQIQILSQILLLQIILHQVQTIHHRTNTPPPHKRRARI